MYVNEEAPSMGISDGTPDGDTNPPVEPETPEEESWVPEASSQEHGAWGAAGLVLLVSAASVVASALGVPITPEGMYSIVMLGPVFVAPAIPVAVKGGAKVVAIVGAKIAARRAAKKVAEKAVKKAAEKTAKKKKGTKVKKKKKLKCGEYGKYGDLKKKGGDGKFDRDHIPSKAALKARAEQLLGRKLKPSEAKAIDKGGEAIAIPRQAHIDISPTHGQTAAGAARDAKDLAGSARRDVDAMLKNIEKYDADGGCKKAYQKAAGKVLRKSNADFDKWLIDIVKAAKQSK
jgi:hypothetical protein